MFEDFYNLTGSPFKLGPDHRFFFPSRNHDKALSYLRYGLQQDEGFIVVTGDIGAGKTTLVSQLFAELDRKRFLAAQIVTSNIDADDVVRMILSAFGVTPRTADKAGLLRAFESFLLSQHRAGRRVLLVVDEAQNLPLQTIEELRMLSNFTVEGGSLFQSFLVGQPQFKDVLADPALEQFRQRVIASYHLGPLSEDETADYVRHRLRLVGWSDDPAIDAEAFALIHRHTGGIPRRINTLCSRLLLFGALEGLHAIDAPSVEAVVADLNTEVTEASAGGSGRRAAAPAGTAASGEVATLLASLDERLGRLERLTETVNSHDRTLRHLLETAMGYLAVNAAGPGWNGSAGRIAREDGDDRT
ncbi:XrtA-associated ATPase [Skermanella mucosa]|uniref:XrtA/PEP-CTERM system-associated ATPase n=1 Tax=Skermanella mucosa TaxID=1789672 RepID=UPI00192B9AEE|nr:XrtA/PEP-CTERM system-associated ATPase [Skermanella mucosa]UEM20087.1 XrtA-associated ATPase [Skermanella mucosa]